MSGKPSKATIKSVSSQLRSIGDSFEKKKTAGKSFGSSSSKSSSFGGKSSFGSLNKSSLSYKKKF